MAAEKAIRELDALVDALQRNRVMIERMIEHASYIRERRLRGDRYLDIVSDQPRPLIVEMLTENQHRLTEAGSRWRRAAAEALRAEGLTLEEIGALFGVTRQRASALVAGTEDRKKP